MSLNTKRCAICQKPRDALYWHQDPQTGGLWVYCSAACGRGYSLYSYCAAAGLSVSEFLKNKIDFKEVKQGEVTKMEWPRSFIPLSDPRAKPGVEYLKNERGLVPSDGMYYDTDREGIVFPLFFGNVFVGAQIRFIKPWLDKDGALRKIDTLPGSRLGLLFSGFSQSGFMANIKGVIVVEGAFDMFAIQQALYASYGGVMSCPWKVIACSGSGATKHHREVMQDIVRKGLKVIVAPDSDKAGLEMARKFKDCGGCTHVAFSGMSTVDWNDQFKLMNNPKEFAKWFLSRVNKV